MKDPERYVIDLLLDLLGIPAGEISREQGITQDLRADELEPVEIAMALEEDLGMTLSDEEAGRIVTVGDLIEFVANRTGS